MAFDITSKLGLWFRRRRLAELDSAPLLLDRVRDRGTPIRRQALIPFGSFLRPSVNILHAMPRRSSQILQRQTTVTDNPSISPS